MTTKSAKVVRSRSLAAWLAVGWVGFLLLPWYAIEDGIFFSDWVWFYPVDQEAGPAPIQAAVYGRWWLWAHCVPLAMPLVVLTRQRSDPWHARVLIAAGVTGAVYLLAQGVVIGPLGFSFDALTTHFGPLGHRQLGMGAGAFVVGLAFLFFLTEGLAARGVNRGDVFVNGALGLVVALVSLFIFFPVAKILLRAIELDDGGWALSQLLGNLFSARVWGAGGVVWSSLLLAVLAAAGSTALGLAFALIVTRTRFGAKRLLRTFTVLPIVTPPFVIGLALILAFGRSGAVTTFVSETFGIGATRYIFGLPGILLAQLLAFTPIAFLVLIGVVEGISPSLEEAAMTLRANRMQTFRQLTLPLIRPGLANAFLLGFIESLADFGNPLVLGGSYEVLSTEIYFAVAGAQSDVPRAAALAIVLLALTLAAFYLQRRWTGDKSYVTVTGKADSGPPTPLPPAVELISRAVALPWAAFTVAIYCMILFGGFVRLWGRDHSLTLEHFESMFGLSVQGGLELSGGAWDSLLTTLVVALVSAPLTAGLGLLTAYLLARQRFVGRAAFEFGTMLSFAIPGTVIGVSYILAFNAPPIELTGTGVILVICFVFRNMPVGIRSGLAALSQIDPSLDEASVTLGASSATTIRQVLLPLLRPAYVAAIIYGFVRAMTAVSAVIFLVSADYDLATTYILGRVENGEYGSAIAYASVLVVLMLVAIGGIQRLVGERRVGRRGAST